MPPRKQLAIERAQQLTYQQDFCKMGAGILLMSTETTQHLNESQGIFQNYQAIVVIITSTRNQNYNLKKM